MEIIDKVWNLIIENQNIVIGVGIILAIVLYSSKDKIIKKFKKPKAEETQQVAEQQQVQEQPPAEDQFNFATDKPHTMLNTIEALEQKQKEIEQEITQLQAMNIQKLEEIKRTKEEVNNTAMVLKGHFEELTRKEQIIENNLRLISSKR